MFSSTVSLESTLVSWKVRTMPSRATRKAGMPRRLRPLNDQSPPSGRSNPVSRLKNVVLPAPLGPIRPVITPRWISRWSTSTAVRPPKVRRIPSATTIGSGFFAPGSWGTSWRAARAADTSTRGVAVVAVAVVAGLSWPALSVLSTLSAGIESQLPSVPEDSLRSEDHQQHQREPHEDEPHQAGLVAVHDRRRDDRVGAGGGRPEEQVQEAEQEPEDHRSGDRAEHPGRAAHQEHRVGEEGGVRGEERRVDRGVLECRHDAGDATDQAADDQRLHLVGVDVLAETAHGVLVLADALEDAAPRAAHQRPRHQAAQGDQEPADQQRPEVVGPPRDDARDADAAGERVEAREALVEALEAVLAAEVLQQRDRADRLADDLGRGDGDDREVVRAQAQRGDAERQGQEGGRPQGHHAADPERQAPRRHERRDRVAADRHEAGLAEVEQPGVAEVDVEADRGQAVDRCDRSQTLLEALAEDAVPVHVSCLLTDPLGLAEQALGPDQQNDDEYDECADELELGRDDQRGDLDEEADDQRPDDRAPGRAEAAQDRRREHQQQDLEAARVALPSLVRCSAITTRTRTTVENVTMKTSLGVTRIGPSVHGRGLENWEYWWVLAPARYWKMLRRKIDSPMLTTIIATRPVPRWRRGRHRARSLSQPNPADAMAATMMDTAIVTLVPAMVIVPGSASTP